MLGRSRRLSRPFRAVPAAAVVRGNSEFQEPLSSSPPHPSGEPGSYQPHHGACSHGRSPAQDMQRLLSWSGFACWANTARATSLWKAQTCAHFSFRLLRSCSFPVGATRFQERALAVPLLSRTLRCSPALVVPSQLLRGSSDPGHFLEVGNVPVPASLLQASASPLLGAEIWEGQGRGRSLGAGAPRPSKPSSFPGCRGCWSWQGAEATRVSRPACRRLFPH